MEHQIKNFCSTLEQFISDLDRYCPNEPSKKFLEVFPNIDKRIVIYKMNSVLKPFQYLIKEKDESLFQNNVVEVIPALNLSDLYAQLSTERRKKVWIYLNVLLLLSTNIIKDIEASQKQQLMEESAAVVKKEKEEEDKEDDKPKPLEFNPYQGVGENISGEYGVNEMFEAAPNLQDDPPEAPGVASIASAFGLDKSLNLDQITDQLKNMKPEDIEAATSNIEKILGNTGDEKTKGVLTDMLKTIQTELNGQNLGEGNPINNIIKIAESVANQMKPKMENENIDMSQLLNSTQSIASQCVDKDGNKIFEGDKNPMNLFAQMGQNPEAFMTQANQMLQSMGMGNMDQLQNMDMGQLMQQAQRMAGAAAKPKAGFRTGTQPRKTKKR